MIQILSLGLVAACLAPVFAQIKSDCDPTWENKTTPCPANPALGTSYRWDMVNGSKALDDDDIWKQINQPWTYSNGAAQFTIAKQNQAPTARSKWYFFGGTASIVMKAAKGKGIISSVMYYSDDLDEIDWEFLGDDDGHVQTNYYGKQNLTSPGRNATLKVDGVFSKFHNYTITWNAKQIEWIVDGNVLRTLPIEKAANNGDQYPQTPMLMSIGPWAGGDPELNEKGVVEWAQGPVDYSQAPFTMEVQSIYAADQQQGAKDYTWVNKSGKWGSILVKNGSSAANETLNKAPEKSITEKFDGLSTGTKIGIAAGVGAAALILAIICTICCLRTRKAGQRERDIADADWDKSNSEMLAYREQMASGGFAQGSHKLGPLSPNPQYAPLSPNPQYAPQHRY